MSTCPNPTNEVLTPLNGNNFSFGIQKIPEVSFNVQKVQIPTVRFEPVPQSTPLIDVYHRGNTIEYGELVVTFIIDSGFVNYLSLYNWMVRTCDHDSCFRSANLYDHDEMFDLSDGFLNIMAANKKDVLYSIKFIDMMPYSISQIDFDTQTSDTTPVMCEALFKFSYFVFAKHNINVTPIQ